MPKKPELPEPYNVVTRSRAKIAKPKDTIIRKKEKKPDPTPVIRKPCNCTYSGPPVTPEIRDLFVQDQIKHSLRKFENRLHYGPHDEKRTCILSHGETFSWTEKTSTNSWIAVSGTKTTCVVSVPTRTLLQEMEERKRCRDNGDLPYPKHSITMLHALAEMIDSSGPFRKRIGQKHETGPVAVVSVSPGTIADNPEKERRQASDAINFLEAKLKDLPALTAPETLQIAVCALYYLFGPNFRSSEIQVRVSYWWDGFKGEVTSNDVEMYLATIKETIDDTKTSGSSD